MTTTIAISLKEQLRNLGRTGGEEVIRRMYELTRKHLLTAYLYDETDTLTIAEVRRRLRSSRTHH